MGGGVILTTPNNQDLIADSVYCPFCDRLFSPVQHVRSWTQESISEYVSTQGFTIVNSEEVNFREMYMPLKKKVINELKKMNAKLEHRKVKKKPTLYCVLKYS